LSKKTTNEKNGEAVDLGNLSETGPSGMEDGGCRDISSMSLSRDVAGPREEATSSNALVDVAEELAGNSCDSTVMKSGVVCDESSHAAPGGPPDEPAASRIEIAVDESVQAKSEE